ncbi:MAG: ABC transporter transmembrane domain-containing protein, partial [Burkholderiales bacterium]
MGVRGSYAMPNPLATKDRAALTLARQAISACQGHLWVALFISLLINVLMLVPPLYMLQIYDRVLPSQNIETLLMLSLICIGLLAALGVFEWLRSKILSRAALRFDQTLSRPVVNAAFSSRLARRDELHGTAVQDLDTVRQFIQGRGIITLFDAPWIPIFLFTVFLIDPWLGWVATGGTLALLALAALTEVISRGPLQRSQTANVKARRLLDGQLAQAEVIQAMGMKAKVAAIWGRIHSRGLTEAEEALERIAGVNACSRSLRIILQSGVLGVGAYAAIEGRITPGMMIAASILVGRAMAPMELLIGHWRGLRQTQSAWRRVDHLLRLHPQPTFSTRLPRPEGDLRIEQLAVSPPGSQKIVLQ